MRKSAWEYNQEKLDKASLCIYGIVIGYAGQRWKRMNSTASRFREMKRSETRGYMSCMFFKLVVMMISRTLWIIVAVRLVSVTEVKWILSSLALFTENS